MRAREFDASRPRKFELRPSLKVSKFDSLKVSSSEFEAMRRLGRPRRCEFELLKEPEFEDV